jgi:hypothetical protein
MLSLSELSGVKDILLDAVKILLPATITAVLAYKITKNQMNFKLKEISRNLEFDSREHLFNYYKERSRRLLKKHDKLNESLSRLMGFAIGYSSVAEKDAIDFLKRVGVTIRNFSRVALMDSRITKKEMGKNGLNNISEFSELDSYVDEVRKIDYSENLSALQKNIVTLIEIYSHLHYCQQLMLEKQIIRYFKVVDKQE